MGAGKVGTTIARAAVAAGYDVRMSGSGSVSRLALTAEILAPGATPSTTSEVVKHASLILLAVPMHRFRELDHDLFDGRIVIDAMNYWEPIDGNDPELAADPAGSTSVVQRWFPGARIVKSLNQLGYHEFEELRRPRGAPDRLAQGVAADDSAARAAVMELVDRLGFDPVDAGTLADTGVLGPDGSAFGGALPAGELRELIARNRARADTAFP
ncbi:MAG: NAD(P)-binding domain-containing protein [Microbacteriaceae bacterium]